ncbi:adenine methylase [Lactococcus hodotermopsidis]|uniref:Adenine methylase n=1 Tax=Pseudolactococcus hodotermopsidis TaxID=2709157 RepID=A0A6A0BFL4_9LACT|nr:MT-A70 family methyltransferase [Lactococcus hodotermopsidis]GFH43503.1 adenine methylase [Lactococcus hodotermopsidis]
MSKNINEKQENHQPKKYKTILADPPWDVMQKGNYGAINHYNLMTLDQIKAMPVADLAEENAHCWLWVTNGTLEAGYDVLRTWGFRPVSIFTWVKPRLGLGNYLRNSTEQLLLGVRGKAPIKYKGQMNWGFFPLQDHSHKPEEVYDIIERCSDGKYLELFARRPRFGWDVWGNQIKSDVKILGYPVPEYAENCRDFTIENSSESERENV